MALQIYIEWTKKKMMIEKEYLQHEHQNRHVEKIGPRHSIIFLIVFLWFKSKNGYEKEHQQL